MPREGTQGRLGPSHATRIARLERTLRYGQAGILVLLGAIVGSFGSIAAPRAHAALALAMWLVAIDVLARGPRVAQVVVISALTLAAAAPLFAAIGDSTGGVVASATTVCIVRALRGRVRLAVLVLVLASLFALRRLTSDQVVLDDLQLAVMGPIVAFMSALLIEFLEQGTARADAAAAEADTEALALSQHQAVDRALRQTRRVLHDEILTALSAVAAPRKPVTSSAGTTPRALSRRAVDSMLQLTGGTSQDSARATTLTGVDEVLAEVIADSPVTVGLRVASNVRGRPIPTEVEDTMRRALGEALRNVARHTGCTDATLEVVVRAEAIELEVRDTGGGIRVLASRGVGTAEAIHGAVEAIGGQATITNDRHGCVVRLTLPIGRTDGPRGALRTARAQVEAAGGPIGELVWPVAGPLIAMNTYVAIRTWVESGRPPGIVVMLLVTLTVSIAYCCVIARGAPPVPVELAFQVAFTAIVVVSLATSPREGLINSQTWPLGFIGNVMFVGVFLLPLPWSLAFLSINATIMLAAWQIAPTLSPGAVPIGALNALALTPLVPAVIGALVRRDGRSVLADRTARLNSLAELELRRQLSRAVSLHLDHTRRVIVPWLAKVAGGELDPADPAVRAHARVLEREARDDLHAAGFFDDRLREDVSRYRANGGTVEIRPGLRPGSHARVTGALLGSLVTTLPPLHRITVSPTPQDPERARVAVVPPPPAPLPAALPRGARLLEHDQDRLVLTVAEWTEPVVA